MNRRGERIGKLIDKLPPYLQERVEQYLKSLLSSNGSSKIDKQSLTSLRGSLKHLKEKYTSVELQHEIHKQRGEQSIS